MQKADLYHGGLFFLRSEEIPGRLITTRLYTRRIGTEKFEPASQHIRAAHREPSKKLEHGYLVLRFKGTSRPGEEGLRLLKSFPIETLLDPDFNLVAGNIPKDMCVKFVVSCTNFVGDYETVLRERLNEKANLEEAARAARASYNHVVKMANTHLGDDPLPYIETGTPPQRFALTRTQMIRLMERNPTAR